MKKELAYEEMKEVQREFPFPNEYLVGRHLWYYKVIQRINSYVSPGSSILSVGSGPCDFEAILSKLGYKVTALDDLNDPWHLIGKNQERIKEFANKMDVNLFVGDYEDLSINGESFDMVISLEVIEHISSPREYVNNCIKPLKDGGILLLTTPNLVDLPNRIRMMVGKTPNVTSVDRYYWTIGDYRSHIREYTPSELRKIAGYSGLTDVRTELESWSRIATQKRTDELTISIAAKIVHAIERFVPTFRDKIILVGEKPATWEPVQPSLEEFEKHHDRMVVNNLDDISESEIISTIQNAHRKTADETPD